MTATLHDLLKSYREGGVFPSYDQLAAIAGQDQIGAAVRGEAVADDLLKTWPDEIWLQGDEEILGEFQGESETVTWCSSQQYGGDVRYIRADLASHVSARAADAPSEPSEPLLTMAKVNPIRDTIKPGDGWDGDNWDFALANAVAATVKSRAADALSSQPTEPVADVQARVRDAVAENLRGLYYCGRVWSAWSVGTMGEDDFSPAEEDDDIIANITDAVMATIVPASSQPTDGGVRNG